MSLLSLPGRHVNAGLNAGAAGMYAGRGGDHMVLQFTDSLTEGSGVYSLNAYRFVKLTFRSSDPYAPLFLTRGPGFRHGRVVLNAEGSDTRPVPPGVWDYVIVVQMVNGSADISIPFGSSTINFSTDGGSVVSEPWIPRTVNDNIVSGSGLRINAPVDLSSVVASVNATTTSSPQRGLSIVVNMYR